MLRFLDLLCGRYTRLDGPTVRFTYPDAPTPSASAPTAEPVSAYGPAAATSPGSNPGSVAAADNSPLVEGTGVGFPQAQPSRRPGAGRVADDCIFWLDDPGHYCLNSYGEPVRPGQSCFDTARAETLRSFAERHPRWAPIVLPPPPTLVEEPTGP